MHSSRMRTVRNSSRLLRGVPALGGAWSGGGGRMPGPWGGACYGEGGIPACTEADPPPLVNRMTDRCKNIIFATSLRTVKMLEKVE